MKKAITILFLLASIKLFGQENFSKQVDQLLKESAAVDAFSGNVLIAKDGKVIYKNSVGMADWERKIPLNDSTLFNIGSIGKDFTQVIMIQLATEGKIKYDDALNKYLQLFPEAIGKKITLRMLLTMQSGLGDYHDRAFGDLESRLDYIKTLPLLFEPGTSREYSNSGYVVLAAVIEKVTSKSFDQNVRERIFLPLKMNHSEFIYPGRRFGNKASGTMIKPNGKKQTEHEVNDEASPSGDGGEYSTAPDLMKFYSSIVNDNQIISDDGKENFFSRFDPNPKISFKQLKENKKAVLGYAGGLNGWNACADIYFGINQIVISLSNFDQQPAEDLNHRIHQISVEEKYDAPQLPRFVFAYNQCKELGVQKFIIKIDSVLKKNNYDGVQGPYFFNQIGMALAVDKRNEEAKVVYSQNIKLFPDAPRAYILLAKIYDDEDNDKEAISTLKVCLSINPDCDEATELLANLED